MKEKIVFFGAGPYVAEILEILEQKFDIVLNVSSFSESLISHLSSLNSRVAVLASFGKIIPDDVLNLFEYGILNIHPSLLPKYRGPTPVQSAILAGEKTTGVSIIKLDNEVDHGPVLCMIDHTITDSDTSESLYKALFKKGAELLVENLPKYLSGDLKLVEQDHSKATFTKPLTRTSGLIDINDGRHANGDKLDLMIRAFYPWPGVWFKYQCHPEQGEGSLLDGKIIKLLPNNMIQVEGKRVMSFKDFANGYPEGAEILQRLDLILKL